MPTTVQRSPLLIADRWRDFQVVDCGDGMKQEKWGPYTLVRPDPQVLWPRKGGGGRWEFRRPLPEHWDIRYEALGLTFRIKPTSFKHTGLFPEQAVNWDWISARIKEAARPVSVLNLFGYTGAATCAAAAAGASVCHVDASEGMVKWCRENAQLSGLSDRPIRYISDDCLKFVRREVKRGRKYDAVIMDPPTYGRGSTGELWRLEDNLWELLLECRALLTGDPLFFLINAYTARLSPTVVANLLSGLLGGLSGSVAAGEVGLPVQRDGRILPCGIYGRWSPKD
jgi:23S rRNA (cytosine1962-C5)-methyltransferase